MRIVMVAVLCLALAGSLILNAIYLYEDINTTSVYDIPRWSSEEHDLLVRAYRELITQDHVPIGIYPYEISTDPQGYTVKFRLYEFLQLRATPFGRGNIYDGCVYYHFNRDVELIGVTECG